MRPTHPAEARTKMDVEKEIRFVALPIQMVEESCQSKEYMTLLSSLGGREVRAREVIAP